MTICFFSRITGKIWQTNINFLQILIYWFKSVLQSFFAQVQQHVCKVIALAHPLTHITGAVHASFVAPLRVFFATSTLTCELLVLKLCFFFPSSSVPMIGMFWCHYQLMSLPQPPNIVLCPLFSSWSNGWSINSNENAHGSPIGRSCCIIPYKVPHCQVNVHLWHRKQKSKHPC